MQVWLTLGVEYCQQIIVRAVQACLGVHKHSLLGDPWKSQRSCYAQSCTQLHDIHTEHTLPAASTASPFSSDNQ